MRAICYMIAIAVVCVRVNAQQADTTSGWSGLATLYGYVTSTDGSYAVPVVTAEVGQLHLEARYNYEDLRTGSLWAGMVLSWDGDVAGSVTPMIGAVVGPTMGLAPGIEAEITWSFLNFSTEGEYVVDLRRASGSFVYHWTDLTARVLPWLRAGVSVQRTKIIHEATVVSGGPFVTVTIEPFEVGLHLMDITTSDRYGVIAVDVEW